MKKNYTLLFTAFCLFAFAFSGCNQKEVGDISIAPKPATPGIGGFSAGYYVSDATGADANNGLSPTTALKTISEAYNRVLAGDTVFIMNGTYANVGSSPILNIKKSGTAAKYITFKAFPGHTPKIYISGNTYQGFYINGSYITIDGLEFQGDNLNITYADALAAYNDAIANNTSYGRYNNGGISIGGPGTQSLFPHHIIVRNCKIHDFPGGGMGAIQADYITFDHNVVYNTNWYSMYGGSGMSILTPFNSDAGDPNVYKNFMTNNICYSNYGLIPWIAIKALSDGNGIIVDINQTGYSGTGPAYNGRTLVQNNICFNNGGSGIHSFRADHTDIINNTAYNNGIKVGYAEIFAGYATDVKIMNNIMYSRTGGRCNSNGNNGVVTYDYNIYYNGTIAKQGTHDKVANPQFVFASTDGTIANFLLNIGSPAIDGGTQIIFAPYDIRGVVRPKGITVDCGAYEVQ